jgi:hypothetical protein
MSLRENQRTPWREQRALDGPLSPDHPDQVLTFLEWCKLNRVSERTGRRILDAPDGPKVTTLSRRRVGITVRDNRAWQESREQARRKRGNGGVMTARNAIQK